MHREGQVIVSAHVPYDRIFLLSMHLGSCSLSQVFEGSRLDPREVEWIGNGLAANTSLVSLVLDHCSLGDAGMAQIAAGLRENTMLQRLSLCNVGSGSDGLAALFRVKSRTINNLAVESDSFDSSAASALLEWLQEGSSCLTSLDLGELNVDVNVEETSKLVCRYCPRLVHFAFGVSRRRHLGELQLQHLESLCLRNAQVGTEALRSLVSTTNLTRLELRSPSQGLPKHACASLLGKKSLQELVVAGFCQDQIGFGKALSDR